MIRFDKSDQNPLTLILAEEVEEEVRKEWEEKNVAETLDFH